jgi:hypothetical protein
MPSRRNTGSFHTAIACLWSEPMAASWPDIYFTRAPLLRES